MATRSDRLQACHDMAIYAAEDIYEKKKYVVAINPDDQRNVEWVGYFPDIIVRKDEKSAEAWPIEVETEETVTHTEAGQWEDYDRAYQSWYLAVPFYKEKAAKVLLEHHHLQHCTVIKWTCDSDNFHCFWGLPGIEQ